MQGDGEQDHRLTARSRLRPPSGQRPVTEEEGAGLQALGMGYLIWVAIPELEELRRSQGKRPVPGTDEFESNREQLEHLAKAQRQQLTVRKRPITQRPHAERKQ
ncbi:hypothetical protein PAL_GLEAN10013317 [Pteropus alecto]|uniref:Uncharacterized protein n=1 Tax=Pteropus alecto TaxID=9402 RepID=L5KGV3_PTEAL|nr:hypothetical protein PAL_GLEAN10013317 [Pteropus alecto]